MSSEVKKLRSVIEQLKTRIMLSDDAMREAAKELPVDSPAVRRLDQAIHFTTTSVEHCVRCGRKLTDGKSKERKMGPSCHKKFLEEIQRDLNLGDCH